MRAGGSQKEGEPAGVCVVELAATKCDPEEAWNESRRPFLVERKGAEFIHCLPLPAGEDLSHGTLTLCISGLHIEILEHQVGPAGGGGGERARTQAGGVAGRVAFASDHPA